MIEQAPKRPELVFALVCPLGPRAHIQILEKAITDELQSYGYRWKFIHVSDFLKNLAFWKPEQDSSEYIRIKHRQELAFRFRQEAGADALARAAIAEIRRLRRDDSNDSDKPGDALAYILRQLKHPKEIELLRRVYGQSLVVVAGHAPKEVRKKALAKELKQSEKQSSSDHERWARELIDKDERESHPDDEERKFGQNTRDAYPLADVFENVERPDGTAVRRFIQLLFGHPFRTPTPEEMAMYQANAMALRSSDERRQVGAVLVSRTERTDGKVRDADILASGMNEVPRRQGGFYWEGDDFDDARDQALLRSNPEAREDEIKRDTLTEIAAKLKSGKWLAPEYAALHERTLSDKLLLLLERTQFMDISEFMRQVHAEMAALVDAAKRGVAVRGSEMYVTAFPCHNCAKHIIAAGITKVVFLEPYPKSRTEHLHEEEIVLDPESPETVGSRVLFVPFTGIAPRQYTRLFSMAARGRKNGLALKEWHDKQGSLSPRYVLENAGEAYTRTERKELAALPAEYQWKPGPPQKGGPAASRKHARRKAR